ncbi:MAG: cyclopropane fatty acyl phospholipid synthase [Gammaproteobacteria bacterium]|nr:cyclopropane fatty acyl phospholipid synthase [Gammaproteobacteria bacterium]
MGKKLAIAPQMTARRRHLLDDLLNEADIKINGDRPWDLQLHRASALDEILSRGSLGLGESYMRGDWEAPSLDQLFYRILRAQLPKRIKLWRDIWRLLRSQLINLQSRHRAFRIAEHHYDLGNEFYQKMLDKRLTYSCGYWKEATTLDQAQAAKLDLICRKLRLQPGMRLLDIGCGWGSLMSYAAEHYGVEAVGVTVSKEQRDYIVEHYQHLPITVRLQDYRHLNQSFDCIASVGMFEHVGHKSHRIFMEIVDRCLEPQGILLLHTIGKNLRNSTTDPWIEKYIFPNGELPSAGQIGDSADDLLCCEDLHNFGCDYDRTLLCWHNNFEHNWPQFADHYGQHFYRMWRYYLLSCAGAFRARNIQLWQWMFSKRLSGGVQRIY